MKEKKPMTFIMGTIRERKVVRMTKEHMKHLLLKHDGIGVQIEKEGSSQFYFYENFGDSDGMDRAYRHFLQIHGDKITFYTSSWAKQSEIKNWMEIYNAEPGEEKSKVIAEKIRDWTDYSFEDALEQVIQNRIDYLAIR